MRSSGFVSCLRRVAVAAASLTLLTGLGGVGVSPVHAQSADPDSFAPGTDLSNAFPGITLSAVGSGTGGPGVFAVNPSTQPEPGIASTGTLVFGNRSPWPHTFSAPDVKQLRVDFANPVLWVTLDFIANDTTDTGLLRAFNSVGTLLETRLTAPLAQNQIGTLTVGGGEANIAYVLAGGNTVTTTYDAILLDNLRYAIPEPSTLALFGTGTLTLLGCGWRRRGRTA